MDFDGGLGKGLGLGGGRKIAVVKDGSVGTGGVVDAVGEEFGGGAA